jgi:hypothetical protein
LLISCMCKFQITVNKKLEPFYLMTFILFVLKYSKLELLQICGYRTIFPEKLFDLLLFKFRGQF